MAGNTFGTQLRLTTWGESHGPAVGGVLDGFPAGIALDLSAVDAELDRRKPRGAAGTPRREADAVERDQRDAEAAGAFDRALSLRNQGEGLKSRIEELDRAWRLSLNLPPAPGSTAPAAAPVVAVEAPLAIAAPSAPESREDTRPVVTEEEVAAVVSMWTGIPVMRLAEAETARLLKMEETLSARVVGQEQAISTLSRAVRRGPFHRRNCSILDMLRRIKIRLTGSKTNNIFSGCFFLIRNTGHRHRW